MLCVAGQHALVSTSQRLVDNEEERLLSASGDARNPWLRPVVVFAIETVMRAGEILESYGTADTETGIRPQKTLGLQ